MDSSFCRCNTVKLCSAERKFLDKDFISALPDAILVSVLSLLTTKESGRTSVLSKRWRHVWAYIPFLVFDSSKILARCKFDYITQKAERIRYLRCVDQVVSSYKAPTMDEFRLRYFLVRDNKDSIDKWVRFAVEKRVKRLELNFGNYMGAGSLHLYNFPALSSWNSLTSFSLDCVNITGEVLESLMHSCKSLKFLSVVGSRVLVGLKVVGLSLESLKIFACFELKYLEIYAPNLIFLDYCGPELCMPFKSTPKLADLSICGSINTSLWISPMVNQVEVLKLDMADIKPVSKAFPECMKLKTLDIAYDPECEKDLYRGSLLIKACPFLHKFVIRVDLSDLSERRFKSDVRGEEPWSHYHLKIVEIVGFDGLASRFARSLIENAVSLEKLIIDTQPPFEHRTPGEPVDKRTTKARKQAQKLRKYLNPLTELEIR